MQDSVRIFFRIMVTIVMLGGAFLVLWAGPIGFSLCSVIVIVWFILVDHKKDLPLAIRELELSVLRSFPAEARVTLALRLAELYHQAGREAEVEPLFRRIRGMYLTSPEIQRLIG